jgi:hypothetical protein
VTCPTVTFPRIFARALLDDPSAAVLDRDFQAAGGEGAGEDDLAGVLADVDEAAGAGQPGAEAADVEVAAFVALGEAEARHIQAAAVVEIELLILVDDGIGIDRGAEVEAARGHTADHARFGREGQYERIFSSLATAATPRACRCRG